MPQEPSGQAQPHDLVGKFIGLNDIDDSLTRPPGSTTNERNLIDVPGFDATRRQGRDFESLDDGQAVGVIFPLTWDDGSITVLNMSGDSMAYSPLTFSDGGDLSGNRLANPNTPGPLPNGPSFNPFQPGDIPDLTSMMRALSEAKLSASGVDLSPAWRNQVFAFDVYDGTTRVATNVRTKAALTRAMQSGLRLRASLSYPPVPPYIFPKNGLDIPVDFYYADYLAFPSSASQDLQRILGVYNITVMPLYLKQNPEGDSSLTFYSGSDAIPISTITLGRSNYYDTFFKNARTLIASTINANLTTHPIATSAIDVESKQGVGAVTPSVLPATIRVSGYSPAMFPPCPACDPSFAPVWDGSMDLSVSIPNAIYGPSISVSASGKNIQALVEFIPVYHDYNGNVINNVWYIRIKCNIPAQNGFLWEGLRQGGVSTDPTGVYPQLKFWPPSVPLSGIYCTGSYPSTPTSVTVTT